VFDTEPGQPVTALDHVHGDTRVGQQLPQRDPVSVHPGTDLGDGRGQGDTAGAAFLCDPTSLAFQLAALVGSGHPAIRDRRAGGTGW
jgi:hypothetical protein